MEKDCLVYNPLTSFLTEQAQKTTCSDIDNFGLRCSQLQLESIEQSLADFLQKTEQQQRAVLHDYKDFFVDLGECVYEDGMEVLASVSLDTHSILAIDSYLQQLQKVSRLLSQVLTKEEGGIPKFNL